MPSGGPDTPLTKIPIIDRAYAPRVFRRDIAGSDRLTQMTDEELIAD
jgi:hypothetical protein